MTGDFPFETVLFRAGGKFIQTGFIGLRNHRRAGGEIDFQQHGARRGFRAFYHQFVVQAHTRAQTGQYRFCLSQQFIFGRLIGHFTAQAQTITRKNNTRAFGFEQIHYRRIQAFGRCRYCRRWRYRTRRSLSLSIGCRWWQIIRLFLTALTQQPAQQQGQRQQPPKTFHPARAGFRALRAHAQCRCASRGHTRGCAANRFVRAGHHIFERINRATGNVAHRLNGLSGQTCNAAGGGLGNIHRTFGNITYGTHHAADHGFGG